MNFALFMLVTRQIAKETDPIGLQAVSGVMACAILLPIELYGTRLGWHEVVTLNPLSSYEWSLLLSIGVIGTCAHLLMTWSLRFAPSATLAPMQYLEIPIATLFGWLMFKDLPDSLAAAGICVTIAAGLYIILREGRMARTGAAAKPGKVSAVEVAVKPHPPEI